jgi:transketolase
MRDAFITELVSAAEFNKNIALVVGDLGYGVVEPFAMRFPNRFFNAGVAEQNMMGLSAGLASEGYHVFAYSIANFPTFRCAEQIRNDVAYHKLPVTVVAVGGGLAYGNLGYSHHAIQDYALIRTMPNMLIASPGDPMEVRACMRYLVNNPQPSYLRLGKSGEPLIHKSVPEITPGQWLPIISANKDRVAYLTTGTTLDLTFSTITNNKDIIKASLYTMPLWGMSFKKDQPQQLERFDQVITVEDHLQDGGFGSWLLESKSNYANNVSRVITLAINSKVCGLVGKQSALNLVGGLSEHTLANTYNNIKDSHKKD